MKHTNVLSLSFLLMLGGGLLFAGCSKEYDDGPIWEKVNDLDRRVTNIESTLSQLNRDIVNLQVLLQAKTGGVSITGVNQTADGYTVTFSDGQTITLRHGKDGVTPEIRNGYWYIGENNTGVKAEGSDGETPHIGTNGNWWIGNTDTGFKATGNDGATPEIRDGYWWIAGVNTGVKAQGNDGVTPQIINGYWWIGGVNTYVPATGGTGGGSAVNVPIIGVAEYNGVYYWTQTINGVTTFLTDKNGNKFPVSGDGATRPLIQVNVNGYWVISYDGGKTWVEILNENGQPVSAGNGGTCNCTSFFLDVFYSDGILTLILADGQTVQIPCEADADLRYDLVIPENLRDQIQAFMPIYTGVTPPNVEGVFYINPTIVVYCSDYGNGGYAPGEEKNSIKVRFTNQTTRLNTIEIEQDEENVGTSGKQTVYISGKDNNFTVYYCYESVNKGVTATLAAVISGTKTAAGIKDCYYAMSLIDKTDDQSMVFMTKNAYRIFKDGDGLSEYTTWTASSRALPEWAPSWILNNE